MKIAIIADTHWGARGESKPVTDHMVQFFDTVFFPFLHREGIYDVVHIGDLVDRRKYINYQTLKTMRDHFLLPLTGKGKTGRGRFIRTVILPGNHDSYYKNTTEVNAVDLLCQDLEHIEVIREPKMYLNPMGSGPVLFLPWICPENYDQSMAAIAEAPEGSTCFAHLELEGFEMYRGRIADHGMSPSLFKKFGRVFTGHYHRKSSIHNIHYLGAPYEMVWSDYDDVRGFHVWDTRDDTLEFIENPYRLHHKVVYREEKTMEDTLAHASAVDLSGKIVKLIVPNNTNQFWFEKFYNLVDMQGPAQLQVVEDHKNADQVEAEVVVEEGKEYLEIVDEVIDEMGSDEAELLKVLMHDLWTDAQAAAL